MRCVVIVLVMSAAACGRIGFDPLTVALDDAPRIDGGDPGDAADGGTAACLTNPAYVTNPALTNRYREGTQLVSWDTAAGTCLLDGARLWVVDDAVEAVLFTGDWTGVTDVAVEDVWVTLDGTVATFLPWKIGQPDGGDNENCARNDPAGFEDRACSDLRDFVCECVVPP